MSEASTSSASGAYSGPSFGTAKSDHSPLRIGFEVINGGNAAVSAAFGSPVNFGDGKAEVNAIVEDVNAHGGVGGHPIVPVFGIWNVTDMDAGREKSCTQMTEDGHAVLLITVINMAESFIACAAKHHVPVINASIAAGDDDMYKRFRDYLFSPSLMSLNREESLLMGNLRDQKFLNSAEKAGVIIDAVADPQYQRVYKATVKPQLDAWGIKHVTYEVKSQADMNNAVLKMRTDNVKTVFFIAPSGVIEILFMQAAENQNYRPIYGFGDSSSAWFVSTTAPQAQAAGIRGVGSLPLANVDVAQYPTTPLERKCLDLIRAKGENNRDRHSSITATVYCEAIRVLQAVGTKLSGTLNPASLRTAYAKLGTSYQPISTFSTNFASGRTDNATSYRRLSWNGKCRCVTYTTPARSIP